VQSREAENRPSSNPIVEPEKPEALLREEFPRCGRGFCEELI
jgi:hypothetical protein